MSLIKCPDCEKQISDSATSCPNCGRPNKQQKNETQTIELTNKSLKMQSALAMLVIFIGFIAIAIGITGEGKAPDQFAKNIGIILTIVGFIWLFVVKAQTWWKHG